jgi:predicted phosphodiesterase
MRVAALYDIHGNLPALDAVLDQLRGTRVDAIVCGGDAIVGPQSRDVLDRLAASGMPVHYVRGNAEAAVAERLAGRVPAAVPELYRPAIDWTAAQIGPTHGAAIASWPLTVRLDLDGIGPVVFCHATPRDDNEIFTRVTPAERLAPVIAPVNAALLVCGHTHMQFDRQVGGTRVVNAGSVGLPWGAPGAEWLLLGPGVELRRTEYDVALAARAVRSAGYPDAGDFFFRGVTTPPPIAQMEAAYERMSLGAG